jgi:hypothetical protein
MRRVRRISNASRRDVFDKRWRVSLLQSRHGALGCRDRPGFGYGFPAPGGRCPTPNNRTPALPVAATTLNCNSNRTRSTCEARRAAGPGRGPARAAAATREEEELVDMASLILQRELARLPPSWHLAFDAAHRGGRCATCGKTFASDQVVYVRRAWISRGGSGFDSCIMPECEGCRPEALFPPPPPDRPWWHRVHQWIICDTRSEPCEGCGRTVVYPKGELKLRRHFYCCDNCRQVGAYRRRRKWLEPRQVVTLACAVCGRKFQASRSNARTCGSACRQKSYRQRVTGGL